MKDVLLAEWTLLLERNKARFVDLDKISPQIRAALIESSRRLAAEPRSGAYLSDKCSETGGGFGRFFSFGARKAAH
jgi:hypothetical protein